MTDEEIQAHIAEQIKLAVALDSRRASLSVGVKLAKVLADMPAVPKNGRNTHFNYDYRKADDVALAVGKTLAKHGLIVVPHLMSVESAENHHVGKFVMSILDGENGASLDVAWEGESIDNQDKGRGKLITAAKKSFYICLFDIGDDEGDIEDDHTVAQGAQRAPAAPAATRTPSGAQRRPDAKGAAEGTGTDGHLSAQQISALMKQAEQHGLDKKQIAYVARSEKGGNEPTGFLKKVKAERYGAVVSGIEYVGAQIKAKQSSEETAEDVPDLTAEDVPDLEPLTDEKGACTCGAGADAPAEQHAYTCDWSIPF